MRGLEYPLPEAIIGQTRAQVFTHVTTRYDNTAIMVLHRVRINTVDFGAGSALVAAADLQLATSASDRLPSPWHRYLFPRCPTTNPDPMGQLYPGPPQR